MRVLPRRDATGKLLPARRAAAGWPRSPLRCFQLASLAGANSWRGPILRVCSTGLCACASHCGAGRSRYATANLRVAAARLAYVVCVGGGGGHPLAGRQRNATKPTGTNWIATERVNSAASPIDFSARAKSRANNAHAN